MDPKQDQCKDKDHNENMPIAAHPIQKPRQSRLGEFTTRLIDGGQDDEERSLHTRRGILGKTVIGHDRTGGLIHKTVIGHDRDGKAMQNLQRQRQEHLSKNARTPRAESFNTHALSRFCGAQTRRIRAAAGARCRQPSSPTRSAHRSPGPPPAASRRGALGAPPRCRGSSRTP